MSLETLLEAAKYVEQQELRAAASVPPTVKLLAPLPLVPLPQVTAVATAPPAPELLLLNKHQPQPSVVEVVHKPLNGTTITVQSSAGPGQGLRAGSREVHNKLEKNRRAHLKECFKLLKKQLPLQQDEKKSSNLSILHSALKHIQTLKKRERENEHEMERLAREKIAAQQRLAALKKELGAHWDNLDILLPSGPSTTTEEVKEIKEETGVPVIPGYASGLAVLGLHKLQLVGNVAKVVPSSVPVTHIIAATAPNLNAKVVPLMNAQYLMKPVVVVSSPSAATRQS